MRRSYALKALSAAAAAMLTLAGASSQAADLTIGRATEQNSLDPQFSDLGNDAATAENMFESLIEFDSKLRVHPSLAVSWKLLDPLTWEISLRPGVTFTDGTPFTGDDVVFSLNRARDIPNSPGPLASFVRPVQRTEVVDPHTLRVHTDQPTPLLMDMIGRIFIVPAKLGASVSTEDFSSGRAMIGTGPYRFKQAIPGDRVVVSANDHWWGGKPAFDTVTLEVPAECRCPQRGAAVRFGGCHRTDSTLGYLAVSASSGCIAVLGDLHTHDLSGDGPGARRQPVHHRQERRTDEGEPAEGSPRAPGTFQTDQSRCDRRPRAGRCRRACRTDRSRGYGRLRSIAETGGLRSGRCQETADRGRLPERVRPDGARLQQPLPQ